MDIFEAMKTLSKPLEIYVEDSTSSIRGGHAWKSFLSVFELFWGIFSKKNRIFTNFDTSDEKSRSFERAPYPPKWFLLVYWVSMDT